MSNKYKEVQDLYMLFNDIDELYETVKRFADNYERLWDGLNELEINIFDNFAPPPPRFINPLDEYAKTRSEFETYLRQKVSEEHLKAERDDEREARAEAKNEPLTRLELTVFDEFMSELEKTGPVHFQPIVKRLRGILKEWMAKE